MSTSDLTQQDHRDLEFLDRFPIIRPVDVFLWTNPGDPVAAQLIAKFGHPGDSDPYGNRLD